MDKLINCGFKTCNGGNIHLFTSDKHSSSLVASAWLGILPRPSVTFITDCSTLFQAPKEESFRLVCGQQIFWSIYALLTGIAWFTGFPHVDLTRPPSHQCAKLGCYQFSKILLWSSSRAMWTRALFLVLFIKVWSLSRQALRLASVLTDGPSSLSFSQYQSQPCSSQSTTTSRARQRPMHSSAFPWQLKDRTKVSGIF